MTLRLLGILVAAALCATTVYAQVAPGDQAVLDIALKAGRAGRYLEAADTLRPLALTPEGKVRDDFAWSQWAEAEGLLSGEPPQRPDARAQMSAEDEAAARVKIMRASATDAIAEIVRRAKRTRIVILNEDHGVPRSRAFALEVAQALRPLGYDVLAAETFANLADTAAYGASMAKLVADGYARRSSGYYVRDPVYATFVNKALALGYRPVAYEMTSTDRPKDLDAAIAQRETVQTDYLMRRAVLAYPDSKILIYVGHSHVTEAPLQRGEKLVSWMATLLKKASGIDPLTIDQTMFLRPSPRADDPRTVAAARAARRSIVLIDQGRPLAIGQYADAVDLQVIHPLLPLVAGRPGWLASGRRATPVPRQLLPAAGRRLIQAFPAGSADDAVPVDQVIAIAGRPAPSLMLDKRPVRLAFQDEPTRTAR